MTTANAIEQQIRYHEDRAAYLDANPYVHTNMDEEEHRAEAARLRSMLPFVADAERKEREAVREAEQWARVERVKQRRARWGC